MSQVFRALKGWISAFFAPAQDPRQSFAYTYQHQHELLQHVRQAIADLTVARKRLDDKLVVAEARLVGMEIEAQAALAGGDEDLARFKVQRRQIALLEMNALKQQDAELASEQKRLNVLEHQLTVQIEAFFARQELIAARRSAAEAQAQISDAVSSVAEELADLHQALTEAEDRAVLLQARASAFEHRMAQTLVEAPLPASGSALEKQISELNLDEAVEQELERLRGGLRSQNPQPT